MDFKSILIFAVSFIFNIALIVALFALPFTQFLGALGAKLGIDFLFCLPAVIRLRRPELLSYFPLYALYYYIYVLIYPPLVLPGGKIVWKERTFGSPQNH